MLNISQCERHGKAAQKQLANVKERKCLNSYQACSFLMKSDSSGPILRMSTVTGRDSKSFHGWLILEWTGSLYFGYCEWDRSRQTSSSFLFWPCLPKHRDKWWFLRVGSFRIWTFFSSFAPGGKSLGNWGPALVASVCMCDLGIWHPHGTELSLKLLVGS